jgi:hypothetical protein
MHSKDSAYLLSKGYIRIIKDTIGLSQDEDDTEAIEKLKKEKQKKNQPGKDSIKLNTEAVLQPEKKKPVVKDTSVGN